MARGLFIPALIVHGGAGVRGAVSDRARRRRGMLAAAARGAAVLRAGGSALDAVVASVKALEDDPLFNAGYGSSLTTTGRVEMDAGLMVAGDGCVPGAPGARTTPRQALRFGAGAVAAVTRVRNPIALARAVMEFTPHILMAGAGAERVARRAGIELCRPGELIAPRALKRWLEAHRRGPIAASKSCTVGAAALDAHGGLAAATSTGGYAGKLPGRVGDSAIFGAGFFAAEMGAASATGLGEAIVKLAMCRGAVMALSGAKPAVAAARAIADLGMIPGGEGGIVLLDRKGRVGYAHNAETMEVAIFQASVGLRHLAVKPQDRPR